MFALLCFTIAILGHVAMNIVYLRVVTILLLVGVIINFSMLYLANKNSVSISSGPGTDLVRRSEYFLEKYHEFLADRKPVIVDAAFGYYYRDADFVGQSLGEQGIRNFLLKHNVPQPYQ